MNNIIKKGIILILGSIMMGCGSTQYIKTSASDDNCLVNVFRDTFTLLYSFDVDVDKISYARLSDETYTGIYLPSGDHVVTASWTPGSGGVNLDVPVSCKPKQIINIAFSGHVEGAVGGMNRKIYANGLSEDAAQRRMETYKRVGE
ncbi:hypothetical protein [Kaarinaea lacus]